MLYTVLSIFESFSDSPSYGSLFSEEILAIAADSEAAAKEKAIAQGKASEHVYKNIYGETITVQFKMVVDVQAPMDEAFTSEGSIYVRHFRDFEAYQAFEPLLNGQLF